MSDPVEEWIRRSRQGDKDAFCFLVGKYQAQLRAFLARYIIQAEDVFDLTQETFLVAYRRMAEFQEEADFRKWLFGIGRNMALQHLRCHEQRRRREKDAIHDLLAKSREKQLGSEEGEVDVLDRWAQFGPCLEKLKEQNGRGYKLFEMKYLRGMANAQIAGSEGLSEGNVRTILLRSRQLLKKCISKALAQKGHYLAQAKEKGNP